MIFTDSNHRTEGQTTATANIPLYFLPPRYRNVVQGIISEVSQFSASGSRHTPYIGLRAQPHSALTLEALVTPTTTDASPDIRFSFTQRFRLAASLWLPFAVVEGNADLNTEHTELNSGRAAAYLNLAFSRIPVLSWLNLGGEYSTYPFYYNSSAMHSHAVSVGGRFDGRVLPWLAIRGSLMGRYFALHSGIPNRVEPMVWGMQGSLGARIIAGPVSGGINVNYQQSGYPTIIREGGQQRQVANSNYDLWMIETFFNWVF